MNSAGIWMLLAVAVLVVTTGLPVWALLLGTASVAAGLAWICGLDVGVLPRSGRAS